MAKQACDIRPGDKIRFYTADGKGHTVTINSVDYQFVNVTDTAGQRFCFMSHELVQEVE